MSKEENDKTANTNTIPEKRWAEQPKQPKGPWACNSPGEPTKVPEPAVQKCKEPDCTCPSGPGSTSACLDELVGAESGDAGAEAKEKFRDNLTKIIDTAKKANQVYTRDKYEEFRERWSKQDIAIAELLRKLECDTGCWHCVLECHVCVLLHELLHTQRRLNKDETITPVVRDLLDEQYWLGRDRGVKERTMGRIVEVLKAWESPAISIDKALNENKKLLDTLVPLIGSQPGKVIFDVFFRLVPLHLAIAPPSATETTRIDEKYTDFCKCCPEPTPPTKPDPKDVSDCCGPNVGERTFRQQLIPPQAYLIDPNDYFDLICCLVKTRYKPANDALIDVNLRIELVENAIARDIKAIGLGWQAEFEKNARAAIPSLFDCSEYPAKAVETVGKTKTDSEGDAARAVEQFESKFNQVNPEEDNA